MAGLHQRVDTGTRTTLKTKTRLAPSVIQGLKVLSLPVDALAAYAFQSAEENPFLEINYSCELFEFDLLPSERVVEDALRMRQRGQAGDPMYASSRYQRGGGGAMASRFEWDFSRIGDDYIATDSLQSYLRVQASALHLDKRDSNLLEALIENVSDEGYFEGTIAEVAFEQDADADEVERMLGVLQHMNPAGVGARSISECLSLQVDPTEPHAEILLRIVNDHLEDLASCRMGALARKLGVSAETVASLIQRIRAMNPRPGSAFYQPPSYNYVVPDIIVREQDGGFEAEVAGAGQACLSLNAEYLALKDDRTLPEEARAYLDEKCREAELAIRNIDQRRRTLQRFAVYLIQRQSGYFLSGGRELSPMTMQEVADELQVNVSTISRTVQNKYIQTPWGTYPLKQFFTRGIASNVAGDEVVEASSFDIKKAIEKLVAQEPPDKPLSDAKIAALLNDRGIDIKRRTVAKYRMALGIGTQSERRHAPR